MQISIKEKMKVSQPALFLALLGFHQIHRGICSRRGTPLFPELHTHKTII